MFRGHVDRRGIIMKHATTVTIALTACLIAGTAQANNLTHVSVYSVESSQGGVERVSSWSSSTSRDHGGARMHVTTEEIGYGNNPQARLLGFSLPEIRTVPLCNVRGSVLPCNGRGTVVGYRRTWDARGRDGGNFEYLVIPNGIGGVQRVSLQVR
ncbi:MAG: DUF4879 domain-containing protein [Luteibacter jiangsuensis]